MKISEDTCDTPESARLRLLRMNISALAGYLIAAVSILVLRYFGVIDMRWVPLSAMIIVPSAVTAGFIVYLKKRKSVGRREELFIFFFELAVFAVLSAAGFFLLGPMRHLGLVYILIAVIIELPYCKFCEACSIAASSVIGYFIVSCFLSSADSSGISRGVYYVAAFIPVYALLLHVSWQINDQRRKICSDRRELEHVNDRLKSSNVRLRRAQEMTLKELDLASAVQNAFLPTTPGALKGWEISLTFRPCFGVSGDFYDFYYRGETLKGLTIYDVSGHGVSSALLTMIVKPAMSECFFRMESSPLNQIIAAINKTLASLFCDIDHFLTAILLRFDGSRVEYTNAGHPDLVLRRKNGDVTMIARDKPHFKGEPLGIDCREKPYCTEEFTVESGDMILLYTDCMLESQSAGGEHYGEARLVRSFSEAPGSSAKEALDHVLDAFNSFSRIDDVVDDLTVIVLRKT